MKLVYDYLINVMARESITDNNSFFVIMITMDVCVKWWLDVLDTFLVFVHDTDRSCQYRSLSNQNHIFCRFLSCVCRIFDLHDYTERILLRPQISDFSVSPSFFYIRTLLFYAPRIFDRTSTLTYDLEYEQIKSVRMTVFLLEFIICII